MRYLLNICAIIYAAFFLMASPAKATLIDFEGFPDRTVVTNQYPGLVFSNAIILTAGVSLNEFAFPPHSGVNVLVDDGGPISITFSSPVSSFSAYFTYSVPITADAFAAGNVLLGHVSSMFSNNEAMSGVSGSTPNEFLALSEAGDISEVVITGSTDGTSFAMDDLSYSGSTMGTPELSTWALTILGFLFVILVVRVRAGPARLERKKFATHSSAPIDLVLRRRETAW
jgi:hypothetical protein